MTPQRGTALAQTLEVYYGTRQSLVASAKTLHVHPNTVTQRLDRSSASSGPDWNTPANAVDVQLALRLLPLTQRGPAVSPSRAPHATRRRSAALRRRQFPGTGGSGAVDEKVQFGVVGAAITGQVGHARTS